LKVCLGIARIRTGVRLTADVPALPEAYVAATGAGNPMRIATATARIRAFLVTPSPSQIDHLRPLMRPSASEQSEIGPIEE
jgi:hypothetical protein